MPKALEGRECHAHNRLLTSAMLEGEERRAVAREICQKLAGAAGPVTLFLPVMGCNEWDREGGPLHDGAALAGFCEEIRRAVPASVRLQELDCHINDAAFCSAVLAQFDAWVASGVIAR